MDVKPETGFYTRNNWLKASPFGVEIKIRRFITPILFLLGRDRPQLSTVNCQLSTVNCQRRLFSPVCKTFFLLATIL
ncbi:hypothetical protein [Microcoleus sp. CAWBG24]|nr:hypothetical protein [Microcoleus sp. CAWBG24]